MVWKTVAGFAAPVIGSLISGASSAYSAAQAIEAQREANESNERIARENRAFQKHSYQNRYLWQAQDMRRARFNPIYSVSSGVGAGGSLPGATARMESEYKDAGNILASGLNSAVNAYRASTEGQKRRAEVDALRETKENIAADTSVKKKDAELRDAQIRNTFADTVMKNGMAVLNSVNTSLASAKQKQTLQETAVRKIEEMIRAADLEVATAGAIGAEETQKIYNTWYGKILRWVQATTSALGGSTPRLPIGIPKRGTTTTSERFTRGGTTYTRTRTK